MHSAPECLFVAVVAYVLRTAAVLTKSSFGKFVDIAVIERKIAGWNVQYIY
jgi:hypothetical protein